MKKVLIISPYFPPVNTADMHRVRTSLNYFKEFGWEATVACMDVKSLDLPKDDKLSHSFNQDIRQIEIPLIPLKLTKLFGLNNPGLRSFFYYYFKINTLLKKENFDLIFFSSTVFPLFALGRLWKKKFKTPFVIDMQDPWRSDHYLLVAKNKRPPKFWLSYQIDRILEKITIEKVDGIISVSENYITTLKNRYPKYSLNNTKEIPFGFFEKDFEIADSINYKNPFFNKGENINLVYIGRINNDMHFACSIFFKAISSLIATNNINSPNIQLFFIGTSYSEIPDEASKLENLIIDNKLGDHVNVFPNRISYFDTISILKEADILFAPGSLSADYSASKIFNYLLSKKPLLTIFHENSNINKIVRGLDFVKSIQFNENSDESELVLKVKDYIENLLSQVESFNYTFPLDFENYSARSQTSKIVEVFNKAIC